jgi:hypothetical protein
MRPVLRHRLFRYGFVAFTALDLLGLAALVFNQWLGVAAPQVWVLAGVLMLSALPLLFRLADVVIVLAAKYESGSFLGGNIP